MKKISTTISLIFFNLIPLFGVIFFSWNVFSIILIYWLENIVIGFYTVLRMRKAEGLIIEKKIRVNGKTLSGWPGYGVIIFFIMHFGLFTFVHGVFVFAMFFDGSANFLGILFGFIGLLISHGVSYVYNFLGKEEYKRVSVTQVMFMPYNRIIILQFVVIIGGFFAMAVDSGFAIIVLVVVKIVVDIFSHKKEHSKIAKIN